MTTECQGNLDMGSWIGGTPVEKTEKHCQRNSVLIFLCPLEGAQKG